MNLRELVGVLGHELRTPLAAILGYQELLSDGIYGELDARQMEPIDRIQFSAHQLLHLIDGLQELVDTGATASAGGTNHRSASADEIETISCAALLDRVEGTSKPYATGRGVILERKPDSDRMISGVPTQRFLRAADLALIAAIKSSTGRTLFLAITDEDNSIGLVVEGTLLSITEDDPNHNSVADNDRPLTAARLRLAMAASTVRIAGGFLRLLPAPDSVTLELRLPRATS